MRMNNCQVAMEIQALLRGVVCIVRLHTDSEVSRQQSLPGVHRWPRR